jgi:hypothetical protein
VGQKYLIIPIEKYLLHKSSSHLNTSLLKKKKNSNKIKEKKGKIFFDFVFFLKRMSSLKKNFQRMKDQL